MKVQVKWHQTLCDPMDCSLSGFSVHGIFQARVLEWMAISFFRGSSRHRNRTRVSLIAGRCFTVRVTREATRVGFSSVQSLSRVRLFASPWIAARQASLSITNQSRVGGMKRSIFNWLIGLSGYNERALYPLLPLPSNTPSHLLFLPIGNNSGRYPGFLACDSSFLIPLALFFFSPSHVIN